MMETSLQLIGTFLVIDLIAAIALFGVAALIGRRSHKRAPLSMLLGAPIFLAVCLALIYSGLWMVLQFGK